MASPKTPTVSVRFVAAPRALDAPVRALLIGPKNSTGTATTNTPTKIVDAADGAALFGVSEMADAISLWFQSRASQTIELYGMGVDLSAGTGQAWTATFTATAAEESGTMVFRFGSYTLNFDVTEGDDEDAIATAFAAAVTASTLPLTAAVDGVNANEVDLVTTYKGAHGARFPISFDLYRDRGERGVAGVSVVIAASTAGTGDPTFSSTLILDDYQYYLTPFRTTGWLDDLEVWITAGWDDRNNFARALVPLAGAQSALVTFGDARNDKHVSYFPISNAPMTELEAAVTYLDAIVRQTQLEGTANISGQGMPVPLLPAFTTQITSETVLDVGLSALRSVRTSVTVIRAVMSYREADNGAEDLVQFDLGTIQALAELGDRLASYGQTVLGKAIVAANTPLTPLVARKAISTDGILGEVRELLKAAWREALVFADSEDAVSDIVTSIEITEESGRKTGFSLILDPEMVRHVTVFDALVQYS
jgi:phage tail sheath gpL-like